MQNLNSNKAVPSAFTILPSTLNYLKVLCR